MPNTLPSQASPLTTQDLNAVIQSNTQLVQILEQINVNLGPLRVISEETGILRNFVKEDLVDNIVRCAVVEKQLDITNETSKLAASIKETISLLKSITDKINKTIWVIILVTTLYGGVPKIYEWFFKSEDDTKTTPTIYWDINDNPFIISHAGDTLYVSRVVSSNH